MKTQVYILRALTNLHPGSGDAGYGVVDKLVQRDPITTFPTIHMSGIKGALREYFESHLSPKDPNVIRLFGSNPQEKSNKVEQGQLRFISAELLGIPVPSKSPKAFDIICDTTIVDEFVAKVALFGYTLSMPEIKNWEHDPSKFVLAAKELPVIARNHLDNGESKNLWYEEFVPRESIFGCIIQGGDSDLKIFQEKVNGNLIQIGGNATVGYGYCLFTCKNLIDEKSN